MGAVEVLGCFEIIDLDWILAHINVTVSSLQPHHEYLLMDETEGGCRGGPLICVPPPCRYSCSILCGTLSSATNKRTLFCIQRGSLHVFSRLM